MAQRQFGTGVEAVRLPDGSLLYVFYGSDLTSSDTVEFATSFDAGVELTIPVAMRTYRNMRT